jgi:hypothetical protein
MSTDCNRDLAIATRPGSWLEKTVTTTSFERRRASRRSG